VWEKPVFAAHDRWRIIPFIEFGETIIGVRAVHFESFGAIVRLCGSGWGSEALEVSE
jgi:hypothetical protein